MNIAVKIDAAKTLAFLGAMPKNLEKALNTGIAKASFLIERGAKNNAPVDTGRLRSSIHTVLAHLQGEVSTNVAYAVYVHQGTKFMTGRPFMKQAADEEGEKIKSIIDEELKKALS